MMINFGSLVQIGIRENSLKLCENLIITQADKHDAIELLQQNTIFHLQIKIYTI